MVLESAAMARLGRSPQLPLGTALSSTTWENEAPPLLEAAITGYDLVGVCTSKVT